MGDGGWGVIGLEGYFHSHHYLTVTCQVGALRVRVAIIGQVVQALVYILAVALPNIPVSVRTDAPGIQRVLNTK
jgi:hypothetical protein